MTSAMQTSYKGEKRTFSVTIEKSYNKTVIDFNSGEHKDLSTIKNALLIELAASLNIIFWVNKSLCIPHPCVSQYCGCTEV